jgi:hypothetical protein
MADWNQMKTRVKASKDTWISQLSYDVFYFVGVPNVVDTALKTESNIIVLPYNDREYPPVNKTFAMWSYFYDNHAMKYEYFAAADTDTYVNVRQLETMIKQLNCSDCYVGYPGWGGEPPSRLGIKAPYCYGLGYVISRSTLLQFGPHLNTCQMSIAARHSDTEMGRCIYNYVHNLSCSRSPIPFDALWYTVNENDEKVNFRMNKRQQMQIDFPQSPPTRFFKSVMIHPLKEPRFFYRFHQQVILHLRPILSPVFAAGSCVANPILQQEIHPQSTYISECPPSDTKKSIGLKSLSAFVLTLPGYDQRVSKLINAFDQHGTHVERFNAAFSITRSISTKLTDEQWRLRMIMTNFFQMALDTNLNRVLVLEDDAIPHRQFSSHLRQLLSDSRCGQYMLHKHSGGILMLGTTVWEEGWHILDKLSVNDTGLCNNICTKTSGSFAVIYHRATFKTILDWLNTTIDDSYDQVFIHLSRLGYPVRFAIPNLVIKDVRHISLIHQAYNDTVHYDLKQRASIHRWTLSNYMLT